MLKKQLTYLFLCFSLIGFAQETSRFITGTVSDKETGELLPGATVMVKGTFKGGVTNTDGQFSYRVVKQNVSEAQLEVSFIGYLPKTFTLGQDSVFHIALESAVNDLNEVVITSSYGTKKLKQEVVGSITSVKPQDLVVESAVTSIDQLLEGQAAGMLIENTGGGPNTPVNIHIRGVGTLSNNSVGTSTQPLIIVDGVFLSEEISIDGNNLFDSFTGVNSEDPNNPLAKIGITDIESINILKDAAAVSLYGADGSNGVIIIETKRGVAGRTKVAVSSNFGVTTETNAPIYLNGEQYREVYNTYLINSGRDKNPEPWNGIDTDWHDLVNDNGYYQNYNISISGGKDRITMRTSVGVQDIQDPQINNTFQRINSNISMSYEGEKLKTTIKASPSYSVRNTPNSLSSFAVAPDRAPYNEDGSYKAFDTYGNPIAVAHQNKNLTKSLGLVSSIRASYQFTPELSATSTFGLDYTDKETDKFFSGENKTGEANKKDSIDSSILYQGKRILRYRKGNSWNFNINLNYNKEFGDKHNIDALLGLETRGDNSELSYSKGMGFVIDDIPQPIESAYNINRTDDSDRRTARSLLSQVNYSYAKKYFVLLNGRIDQNSSFGGDNQTAYNGGFGLGWDITKEDFLPKSDWLHFLKYKISYGSTGNARIGSYKAKGLYTLSVSQGGGYNYSTGYAKPSSAPNPNLGWEINHKFNTGFDLNIFKDISLNIEFFHDRISDMITSRNTVPESGYDVVQINGAEMYNQGFEFSISTYLIKRDNFRWKSSFNSATVKNVVTHLKDLGSEKSLASTASTQRVGYATTVYWGYEFKGINPLNGRELYEVDGRIVDADVLSDSYKNAKYWKPIGNSQPDIYGGMSNKFTLFKRLDITANLSYQIGSEKLIKKELIDHYNTMSNRNIGINAYYEAWRKPGDITRYSAITENIVISNSSKYVYNTSNIKLSSINMSYRIPVKYQWINNLSVKATCSNAYIWYFDKSPEGRNGIKELYNTYPDMRTYSFGVSANF